MNIVLGELESRNIEQDNRMTTLKENVLSDNLFNEKLLADKSHSSTGIATSQGTTTCEDYIPVVAGKSITISNNGIALPCSIYFYKADYSYISVARNVATATVPAGTAYMAFNVATTDLGNTRKIMVNYGAKPMQYVPYVNAIEELSIAKYRSNGTNFDDPNTTTYGLILTSLNTPEAGVYYYIKTFFYQKKTETANRSQIAIGYITNKIWQRYYYDGIWSNWQEKTGIALAAPNTDFNTLTDNKTYYFGSVPTGANKPINKSGVLEIFTTNTSLITQRYTTYDGQNMYTRGYYNETWSNWKVW